ncbi:MULTISPECIES: 16S rRNA (guanine(527)-N(7))-methyltransferase RsmG [Pacificibacter]|uniref:16S rRNA (guanine(527)-N(7))-methyltransferase RsmG n=1 Tax=Pacificibacter TaxID=1042323 RepID=UPI001C09CB61|nr:MULTISPECIES: 16S rRNA (guanine(527)-N(7))-methyltransferase RsmG [Pacificibacter]MBU2936147.1 16S rRNA (guanine(527)-N(7))-methyltransferase RsmG [Pacificibacter marinus]MDO6615003.1 16S rRNA (guanine(527)-N(7))-methyltransferase RsmG [Pacificibacter sp. 1_MG-2023]
MSTADDFGLDVSRETFDRLSIYEVLLKKWNPVINLVSKSSIADLRNRHFIDSAQVFSLMPEGVKTWVDIGSGGGFPGMVCAMICAEKSPNTEFHLVESDMRKATFLRSVAREAAVRVQVHSERIEKMDSFAADVMSARALASLDKLLEFSAPHLQKNGVALFPKGENYKSEFIKAQENWRFDCEEHQSITGSNSVVLKIGNIQRV